MKAILEKYAWIIMILVLSIHAFSLAFSATKYSPAMDEPGHMVAGLSHWKFGRFELYRVNPPLVRMVATLPVEIHGYEEDWSAFQESPGQRPVFNIGSSFVKNNGANSLWLFTIARWACIPFSLLGGLVCYLWSRELWGSNIAGLVSVILWSFDPNVLGNGALITPDCAAAAMGLAAVYMFWQWLKRPDWGIAVIAGVALGLAELTKMSWIILFGIFPLLWIMWKLIGSKKVTSETEKPARIRTDLGQLTVIIAVGLFILNLGYAFDGVFPRLGDLKFVSKSLVGESGETMNRFEGTILGSMRVPFPKQYLLGLDVQRRDLETFGRPSYLRGQWKDGGWWYYYLYGAAVKMPHGTQGILILGLFTLVVATTGNRRRALPAKSRDLLVLLVPPITLWVIVSSHLEFNHNFRYVLPAFGFLFVFAGIVSYWFVKSTPAEPDADPLADEPVNEKASIQ